MTNPDKTIQVTSLPNLAQVLPYILGHYPDDSIAFHSPGPNFHDGPTMTCPLPDDPAEWEQTAKTAARTFIHYAHSHGHNPDQGIIIYLCREPHAGQTPWDTAALLEPLAEWLTDALHEHRGTVLQTLGLIANRWWAFECPTDGCCEGEPLPSEDDPTSVAAQMARLGRTPGPRTRDILKEFQPTDDRDFAKVLGTMAFNHSKMCSTQLGQDAALDTTHVHIETAMRRFRDGATELDSPLAARLIVGLQDDGAVEGGMAFAEDHDLPHARRLWAYLARHCAAPFTQEAVPVLTLLGFVAWRQDDLITARLAFRQAIATDPDYELATGIHLATIDGEDPRELLALARQARAERKAGL
ncbi:DUF4192 domain-containing protein [Streptomyces sp. Isolate_219]|uniref:DUF4192 domain-containing protein n=1 Tax=Streptomyces sp. Isolate_219 TaxID=2950110 RepID=UPI0021C61BCC|nr:DUF4192 domain-containing protein [Streptomyces sp. Isolate_219]MCR8573050.1 DUF4192 domain-containing protein [Streptomyces sp. Isolate_219]